MCILAKFELFRLLHLTMKRLDVYPFIFIQGEFPNLKVFSISANFHNGEFSVCSFGNDLQLKKWNISNNGV